MEELTWYEKIGYRIMSLILWFPTKIFYGVFSSFFCSIEVSYICFLDLIKKDGQEGMLNLTLKKMDKIFRKRSKKRIIRNIKKLLKSVDWRPHLVACIAILKLEKEEQVQFYDVLWTFYEDKKEQITLYDMFFPFYEDKEKCSWVRPQMLATLSLIDSEFVKKIEVHGGIKGDLETISLIEEIKSPFLKEEVNTQSVFWRRRIQRLMEEKKI